MRVQTPFIVLVLVSAVGFSSNGWAQSTAPRLTSPAIFTDLDYPVGALANNDDGRVVLNVTVTPVGTVSDAAVATSTGSELLDRASIRAAKVRLRFEPAMQNGQAVSATTQVEASWVLPLTPTQHEYFDVPDSGDVTMAVADGPYMARYSDYPPAAAAGSRQGVVGVRYQVGANGNVTDAVVVEPSDNSRLNNAALRIAQNRSFTPAMRGDVPVSVWQGLTVSFAILPAVSSSRRRPCFQQPILARDSVLVGATPYRVEVSYLNAKYTTRWETRQVGDWVGTWVRVTESGDPTEVLLYTNDGWMTPSQPVVQSLMQGREYPTGAGGCWYYDAVSILG